MIKKKKCKYKEVEYDCPCWFEGWLMGEAEYEYNHPEFKLHEFVYFKTNAKNSTSVIFNERLK